MNRIFITGDIHADISRFSTKNFFTSKIELDKNDYLIILGDFGLIWNNKATKDEEYKLDYLDSLPWTTLFIDGNHENFDRLESYPTKEWCGGRIHEIRPSVYHLCRGEIFNIAGKKFLAMGGAESHDIQHGIIDPKNYKTREEMKKACKELEEKCGGWQFAMYRIKGESWWEHEVPTAAELDNALHNLAITNFDVDYVLSHEAPASCVVLINSMYKPKEYSIWLENEIRAKLNYKTWFNGHYHVNKNINAWHKALYQDIIELY